MEHYKTSKLLNDSVVSKVNDLSGVQYSRDKNVRFKTPMLWSDLCDYSDVYLVVKETIDLGDAGNNVMTKNIVVFKRKCSNYIMHIKNQQHIYRKYVRSWYCYAHA